VGFILFVYRAPPEPQGVDNLLSHAFFMPKYEQNDTWKNPKIQNIVGNYKAIKDLQL